MFNNRFIILPFSGIVNASDVNIENEFRLPNDSGDVCLKN